VGRGAGSLPAPTPQAHEFLPPPCVCSELRGNITDALGSLLQNFDIDKMFGLVGAATSLLSADGNSSSNSSVAAAMTETLLSFMLQASSFRVSQPR
jgi:hypothetical protein